MLEETLLQGHIPGRVRGDAPLKGDPQFFRSVWSVNHQGDVSRGDQTSVSGANHFNV